MAAVVAVGHGASLTCIGLAGASIRSIGGFAQERDAVDASGLDTVGLSKMVPAGLTSPGSFDVEYVWDAASGPVTSGGVVTNKPNAWGATQNVVVTFPQGGNTSSPADVTGVGFITSVTTPELTSDGLMVGNATIQWEGGATNLPVWTDAV